MNSREQWNSILSGCAICCWIFAQEMPQFAHSPGGLFCFFGWDGDSFPFYSGPMLSYVPKAKGCRQKKRLQAGYFVVSTELGIFGAAGYFRVGWKKNSIL